MGKVQKELSNSLEDYLEAIIHLEKVNRVARVRDIADRLEVQMPSVTGALKTLKEKGYVNYRRNSYISLTELGLQAANCLSSKHQVLSRLLSRILDISEERADTMAGQMEHAVDCETNRRLIRLLDFFEGRLRGGEAIAAEEWVGFIKNAEGEIPYLCSEWCDSTYRNRQS